MPLRSLVAGAVLLAATGAARASSAADPLSVYVMTFGPGDHPFYKFGHDAIWIQDREARTDRVYNFGTFRFDSPRLIFDFLGGRLTYWLSVSSLAVTRDVYEHENRTIAWQELALAPEAKQALRARLDDNARPDKRAYKYDYFLDNCATRVRDAVDVTIGGRLRESARAPGRMTLREQALRMTAGYLPLYLALDIVLGPQVDLPIDRWGEMFLPEELASGLRVVSVPDPERAGASRPLVAHEEVMFRADRAPPLELPPARGVRFLLAGLALGLAFVGLGWAARRLSALRVLFGLLVGCWGFAVGFIGCFLGYAWLFTDHVVTHRNQNILLCAPWAIGLSVLGFGVAAGLAGATRKAFSLAAFALCAALGALVLKLGLGAHQDNGALIAFFLPSWLGVAGGLSHLRTRAATAS